MRLELWRQDRFDTRRIAIHDTTAQWATLTVTGPRSCDLIEAAGLEIAVDDQSLPHMAFAAGAFEGAPLRIARVSFTGDRSYELSVPAGRAPSLRARLSEMLPAFDGGLMGLEALMILRAEKGFIVVGKDTDGTTMPHDLGVPGPHSRADESIKALSLRQSPTTRAASGWWAGVAAGEAPLRRACHSGRRSRGAIAGLHRLTISVRPSARSRWAWSAPVLSRMGETVSIYHLGASGARPS
jgi:sarcosine oxidase subunit alpha